MDSESYRNEKEEKLQHRKLNNDINNIGVCIRISFNIQLWTGICGLQHNCRHFYCTVEIFDSVIQFLIYRAVIWKIRATLLHNDEYNNILGQKNLHLNYIP